jgi:hypothetical protein
LCKVKRMRKGRKVLLKQHQSTASNDMITNFRFTFKLFNISNIKSNNDELEFCKNLNRKISLLTSIFFKISFLFPLALQWFQWRRSSCTSHYKFYISILTLHCLARISISFIQCKESNLNVASQHTFTHNILLPYTQAHTQWETWLVC